jgi:methyl-accepting chemotaxis protein
MSMSFDTAVSTASSQSHSSSSAGVSSGDAYIRAIARLADRAVLGVIALGALVAIAVGIERHSTMLALVSSFVLLALSGVVYAVANGSLASRLVLAGCAMAMVALHIQLGGGTTEFHFGVFVTLAFLLIYRDWRPIVLAAALIAVHHIAFDRLQLLGFPFFCNRQPDFATVLAHAGYVIVQAGVEVWMAIALRRETHLGKELSSLVEAIDRDGRIALDVSAVEVVTAGALRLKQTVEQIGAVMRGVRGATDAILGASGHIASGSGQLSQRTKQAASNLQQTATAVGQLTGAVQQTTESARTASQLAASATTIAQRGGTRSRRWARSTHRPSASPRSSA